jgi:hypothetical protein
VVSVTDPYGRILGFLDRILLIIVLIYPASVIFIYLDSFNTNMSI